MKKIIIFILPLFVISIILLTSNNCGLQDNQMYYQEPRNIALIDPSGQLGQVASDNYRIGFMGYQQNEDDYGNPLFIGFDIYYYFTSPNDAKKASVRNPRVSDLTHDIPLRDFTDSSRFPTSGLPNGFINEIYQYVTIPLTPDMIKYVINEQNNNNVQFCFKNRQDQSVDYNPTKVSSGNFVYMQEVYPNFSEYINTTWGNESDDTSNIYKGFKGFYDKDYYDAKSISPNSTDVSGKLHFKVNFWIITKGFNDTATRTIDGITESGKSQVFTLEFIVDPNTKYVGP